MFSPHRLLPFFLALLIETAADPVQHDHLGSLLECRLLPNPHTRHLRIPNIAQNISQAPGVHHFNPTIIALPYWAENQYLLVSRVVTEGLHQESVLCEANICVLKEDAKTHIGQRFCTADSGLEHPGGLQCATERVVINVPATPAEQCDGPWSTFPDIPGFHDPRIFWSGKGEPLIIVNSASQYACLGLWITDLRTLYQPLKELMASQLSYHSSEPPISYSVLTELTRNPASTRSAIEKNWFLFFPTPSTSYIHYDLSPPPLLTASMPAHQDNVSGHAIHVRRDVLETPLPTNFSPAPGGRTFAKLLSKGHTTLNLTSALEQPCLTNEPDPLSQLGHWHQATNALKLILCQRHDAATGKCGPDEAGRSVHFAIIHRKFSNIWDLPLRYERYFVVWDASPPFQMRAISRYPVLFQNETASGWTGMENWALESKDEVDARPKEEGKGHHSTAERRRRSLETRNTSFYPNGSITNFTAAWDEDAWLKKDQAYGQSRENWAYFTYTPSIAWAWRPQSAFADHEDALESLNVGYLDDEVILGIGLDDTEQAFGIVKAATLLQCLMACPGMREENAGGKQEGETLNVILDFEREDEWMREDTENRDFLDVW